MNVDQLLCVNEDQRQRVIKHFYDNESLLQQDVAIIKDWVKTQKHLPEIPDNKMIQIMLMINKGSLELTKQKIDMFYTIRSLCPEFFENCNPSLPHMKEISKTIFCIPLPKLTENLERIMVYKMNDKGPGTFDLCKYFAHVLNICQVRLKEDCALRDVVIFDMDGFSFSQATSVTPTVMKKISLVLEKVYGTRLGGIHFVNGSLIETAIKLIKNFLNPKISERIHVHPNYESLIKYFGNEILPADFGGNELSLSDLNDLWSEKLSQHQSRFNELDKLKVNEELRPAKLVDDDILGMYGSFKKLNID